VRIEMELAIYRLRSAIFSVRSSLLSKLLRNFVENTKKYNYILSNLALKVWRRMKYLCLW